MSGRTVDPRFPARLRELREAAGLSLRQLAKAVPCSHVHVWELEQGAKVPSPELAARLDRVLDAGGELESIASGGLPVVLDGGVGWRPRMDQFGPGDAEALAAELVAEVPTGGNALRLAHEWMVAEPPQLFEVRAGRRIGVGTVARVEQRVHQLRLLDDQLGGVDTYTVVVGELQATATLLREAAYTEAVGRRLLVALGELAQLAGWVASDAGRHAEAQRLYLAGARASHAGGDLAGAANNLSSLAYQWSNIGDRRDAALLARTAVTRTANDAAATAMALLWDRAAWAHARAGEARQCERALDQAGEAFAGRVPDADPPWVYWVDPHEMDIMAGRCWTELRRPLRAVPVLRTATAGYGEGQAREAALYLSWLAEALVQAHEVDEAAAVAQRALALSRKARSARTERRMAAIAAALSGERGNAAVDAFLDAHSGVS